MDPALGTRRPAAPSRSPIAAAACVPADEVLAGLGSGLAGLTAAEAARRQAMYGPNAVATHAARLGPVLWQQLRSPLLGLLVAAATASYFVGERTDALIIGAIVALSVGLGVNQRVPGRYGPHEADPAIGQGGAADHQRCRSCR